MPPGTLGDADEATRVRIGANPETEPERLRRFVTDSSVTVRATLAMNPSAPPDANRALADDPDERVRCLLARKLAALAPRWGGGADARAYDQAYETLTALAADAAVRVRAAIADAVKDLPDAPREIVLRLAHDMAVMVSEPVILFSPLLTTEDLLTLIAAAPSSGTVRAVARRPRLETAVTDAVAASDDGEAIQALLSNPSAQIREATLDALIAASADHEAWQEPLVRRPALPPRAARALSEIVATHLLEVLAARKDFGSALAAALRGKLSERLALRPGADSANATAEAALVEARRLAESGKLDEHALLDAIRRGEARLAAALLAVAAEVPVAVVDRAASLRSAKGLISLAWQAGFTMQSGSGIQNLLGHLPPDELLAPSKGGGFPLSGDEMRWQLEFLARPAE